MPSYFVRHLPYISLLELAAMLPVVVAVSPFPLLTLAQNAIILSLIGWFYIVILLIVKRKLE
jgi:hypothetical protein